MVDHMSLQKHHMCEQCSNASAVPSHKMTNVFRGNVLNNASDLASFLEKVQCCHLVLAKS